MTLPLPGLKPNEQNGYTLCPKCVVTWLVIGAVAFFAFRAWQTKGLKGLKR